MSGTFADDQGYVWHDCGYEIITLEGIKTFRLPVEDEFAELGIQKKLG